MGGGGGERNGQDGTSSYPYLESLIFPKFMHHFELPWAV